MASSKSRADFIAWAVSTIDQKVSSPQQTLTLQTWAEYAYEAALNRIARKYDFSDVKDTDKSITTVASTYSYTLPSSTHHIFRLIYEDGSGSYDIDGISPIEFDEIYPYPSSYGNGRPSKYCRRSKTTVEFNRPASEAKTIRLYRSIWPTTDGSSNVEYENLDDVIHAGMCAEIYHQYGLDTDADTWWNKFKQDMDEAWIDDKSEPDTNYIHRGFRRSLNYPGNHNENPFIRDNP